VPIDREKVLQAAQKHVEKKKYDAAIVEYQKLIQDDPNDTRTLLKIGDLQARLQAYPEAIATYDRVGQHYANQGFSLKAIAVYKQIREIVRKHAPDLADRYGHIGPRLAEIYTLLGLTSDALAAWDEVATRLQRGGRDREAVDVFRKMVELDHGNPLPHLRLAEACCRVQALDEAIDSFWTAADLLLNLGRQDDALKVIERILHFRADARHARVAAELYLAKGSREDGLLALAKLQICFQANPKDLDTLGLLGQAFTCIGQEDKAIEVYKEMARVARDQGRADVFDGLLEHLRSVAPDDEQVRALVGTSAPPTRMASSAAPPDTHSVSVSMDDGEVEVIEEHAEDEEEEHSEEAAPIPLLGGRPATDGVAVDDHLEAAEELDGDRDNFDVRAHVKKAVVDAESFRKLRLFPKAVETLHIALEIDPRSLELRDKLREVLRDSGDRAGAVAESVNLAALHIERGDNASAEPFLTEALEDDPGHAGARALFEQIAPGRLPPYREDAIRLPSARYELDSNAPLPSYDLEEISADQALARPSSSQAAAVVTPDEPFHDGPLPSFPLHEGTDTGRLLPVFEELDEISQVEEVPPPAALAPRAPSHPDVLEEALEEAEFFVARGLFEDARTILQEQLGRTPNNPLVLERLEELDAQLGARSGSRTVERSELARPPSRQPSPLDVSASLDALDRIELPPETLAAAKRGPSANVKNVSPDQVFASFKAGIRADVTEGDSATHYDLGLAYKEMGLVTDAIHELELAARDPNRECMCYAMIGMVYVEQRQLERAAESYLRALSSSVRSVEQELNLHYDLGSVYELSGKKQDALTYFNAILRRDPGFRDVQDRIDSLTSPGSRTAREPSGTRSVGDDEEFDRVFSDLFESK
jgi:tetratricopeptide (TPR) repeat protein